MCAIAAGKQQVLRSAQNDNVYLVPARRLAISPAT